MHSKRSILTTRRVVIGLIALPVIAMIAARLLQNNSLEKRLQAIRSQGFPVTLEEFDLYYPTVPNAENAALSFAEAAASVVPPMNNDPDLPIIGSAPWPQPGEPFPEEMRAAIREHVEENSAAFEAAHQAAQLPRSRYPIDLRQGFATLLPHLAQLKKLTQLFRLEIAHQALNGNPAETARSIHTALSAAHSLANEPLLISELVRIACVAITVPGIEMAVNQQPFNDGQLRLILVKLKEAEDDCLPAFRRAMAGERGGGISCFKMTPNQLVPLLNAGGGTTGPPQPLMWLTRITGLHARDFQIYLDSFDRILAASTLPPPKVQSAIDESFSETMKELDTLLGRLMIITRSVLPALSGAYAKETRIMATLRTAQTALAIERYRLKHEGKIPDSLENLVPDYLPEVPTDPTDGEPLLLTRLGKGFRVEAVGATLQHRSGSNANRNRSPVSFTVLR